MRSQPLTALLFKLTHQRDELHLHWQQLNREIEQVQVQLKEVEQKINQAYSTGSSKQFSAEFINPELEINRLNFLIQQQEQRDILLAQLKTQQATEQLLMEKKQRISTELKMLSHYLERQQQTAMAMERKKEADALDEWVMQQQEEQ